MVSERHWAFLQHRTSLLFLDAGDLLYMARITGSLANRCAANRLGTTNAFVVIGTLE